ncbi:MAG: lipid-A-disaccharide synthase [Rickettsiales bacterium]|jgi:lipid-A-disaccharide synthase|nr:lipid-A-disaccharide synthase [Rickettsiales bacterium]
MGKKILVLAGEKSGDVLGSKLIECLREFSGGDLFDISIVGGPLMEEKSGTKSLFPMSDIMVMGLFEVLPKLPRILKRLEEITRFVLDTHQDLLLTIDSPDFCFRVVEGIRKRDREGRIKIFHLVAPSVWFYREGRAKKIAKLYDGLFCLLPFEPPYFEKYGLRSIFTGHPIFDGSRSLVGRDHSAVRHSVDGETISLAPGSRIAEIRAILPIIVGVVGELRKIYNFRYSVLATENTASVIEKYLRNRKIDYIDVLSDPVEKKKTLDGSLMAIAKSGTNTLEIAAHAVPMIVLYRFSFLTNALASLLLKLKSGIKFVSIINILAKREIIPELILSRCTVKNIVKCAIGLLNDDGARITQVKSNLRILEELGYRADSSPSWIIADEICRSLGL